MRPALATGFMMVALAGCLSDIMVEDYKNVPGKVDRYIHENRINPPRISRVEYAEESAIGYLIIADCCDQFNILLDSKGAYMCAPSGGFTGGGDDQCPNFHASIKTIETIWESKR